MRRQCPLIAPCWLRRIAMRHRRVVVKLVATSRPGRSPTTPPPVVVTDAGVRDQQVDLAGLLDRAVHRARVGDIELHPASATQGTWRPAPGPRQPRNPRIAVRTR